MVLLPRIEYKAMVELLPKNVCDKLHQAMIKLAKQKAQLTSTAPNCIVASTDFIGIKPLWDRHTEHNITEWLIRINDIGLLAKTTMLKMKKAILQET